MSNQNPMESSNSPHYLHIKYDFIEENFSSTETYATFKLKFDTMRMMVYYEMPVQRKRAPGKNCDWIRHLSHTENHIIRDPRFQVCQELWDKYLQNFLQQKEINQGPKDTTETSKSSKEWKEQISDKATTSPSEKSPFQVYLPPPVQTNKTQGQIPTPTSETDDGSRKKQNSSDNIQAQTVGQVGLKNNSLTLQETDKSQKTQKNSNPEHTRKSKSILSNSGGIKAKSIQESKTDTIAGSNVLEEYSLATPKPIEDSKICEDIFGTNTEHDEDDSESLFSSGSSLLQIEVEKEDMELQLDGKVIFEDFKDLLKYMQFSLSESVEFYKTAVEISTIDFGAFNQTQSIALSLPKKLHVGALDDYLPSDYSSSVGCTHVCEKKLPWVFQPVLEDLYKVWVPQQKKVNPAYEVPNKVDVLSFLTIISNYILWDVGFQRIAHIKTMKGKGKSNLGVTYNYCPCNKAFKKVCEDMSSHFKDTYWPKYLSQLTCDCEGYKTDIFFNKIVLKAKSCFYHEATKLYLEHMYKEYMDEDMKVKEMNSEMCDSSDDSVKIVSVKPSPSKNPTPSLTSNDSSIPKIPTKRSPPKSNKEKQSKKAKSKTSASNAKSSKALTTPIPRKKKKATTGKKLSEMSEAGKALIVANKTVANKTKAKKNTSTPAKKPEAPLKQKKTKKPNLATFPKNPLREIFNHDKLKKKAFHDCLYDYPDYGSRVTNSYAAKRKQLIHGCTFDSNDYGFMIEDGKWCELFDKVSAMVGSRTIDQHSQDELVLEYYTGEALHVHHPDNYSLCNYVLGQFLSRYERAKVREDAEKLADSNLDKASYSTTDLRYNKSNDISQFQLLRRFISEVVLFNPVWDIGLQSCILQKGILDFKEMPGKLTFEMQCPCSKNFRNWRNHYPEESDYKHSVHEDKVGFKECNSGIFTDVIEFYKHLADWESKCYYHEAMIDIFSTLYPFLYSCAITKRKHGLLKKIQSRKILMVRNMYMPIFTSLYFFSVFR